MVFVESSETWHRSQLMFVRWYLSCTGHEQDKGNTSELILGSVSSITVTSPGLRHHIDWPIEEI